MQSYITLHNHHIGLSHINNNMECEDYSLSFADDNLSVAVICDGHGDKNCLNDAYSLTERIDSVLNGSGSQPRKVLRR